MALSAASIIRDFPELHPIQQELRKQIRLSRSGNPRVITWFNLNSGREHFYILKKCKDYEVFAHFWSVAEVVRWAKRYRFDHLDITEVTYESKTLALDDLRQGL